MTSSADRLRSLPELLVTTRSLIRQADRARDSRDHVRAAKLYARALSKAPHNAPIHIQAAHMFKEGGDLATAEQHYLHAIALDPADPDAHLHLAHLYKNSDRPEQAYVHFLRLSELDPVAPRDDLERIRRVLNIGGIEGSERINPMGPITLAPAQVRSSTGSDLDRNRYPDVNPADPLVQPGLFEGSDFGELSTNDPHEIARIIKQSATPPELLARVNKSLYSPLLSIVIPIYNTPPRFLREVLQSVFAQTYTNWEMCIVDDGSSSPSTIAIVDELAQSPDPRIKTLRLDVNRGISGASHAALEMAEGDYIGFLDHDDLLTTNALSEVVALLREHEDIDFVYTDHVMIDHDGNFKHYSRKPKWSPEFLLSTNYIVHFKVVRRTLLLSLGGLQNEIDNVQDLGVTCALAAAGARVRHLAKPLYLWREHRSSVALSTQAKPGIEQLLMKVYERHLGALGVAAKQTWPDVFRASRTGVFQLEFTGAPPSVALIVLSRGSDEDESEVRARFAPLLAPHVTLHVVCLEPAAPTNCGTPIQDDGEMLDFLRSIDAPVVAFANTTAQFLGIDWVTRLARYATLDPLVGAAGGKALDAYLQIRSGGMLLDEDGNYRTIGGGSFDNANCHWFNGQIASNVDAIASQIMATRRNILIDMGGIGFHAFGDAAGAAYSAALRLKGYRIVYDPFSRICDTKRLVAPDTAWRRIRALGRDAAPLRVYEALGA